MIAGNVAGHVGTPYHIMGHFMVVARQTYGFDVAAQFDLDFGDRSLRTRGMTDPPDGHRVGTDFEFARRIGAAE